MFDQLGSEDSLDRVIESVQELLAVDDRDVFKVRQLMNILDESVEVKKRIRAAKALTKVEQEEQLKLIEETREEERNSYAEVEQKLNKDRESVKVYKDKSIALFSKVLLSAYKIKQIESMIATNLRREEINALLRDRSEEIQREYMEEEAKICESYTNNRTEDEILKLLQGELRETVRGKEEELQRLEEMVDRSQFEERAKKDSYRMALDRQNEERRKAIQNYETSYATTRRASIQAQKPSSVVNNTPTSPPERIAVRVLPNPHPSSTKIETVLTVVFAFLSLILLTYALTRQ